MAYNNKNVIVGAAALFISDEDFEGKGIELPAFTPGESAVRALEPPETPDPEAPHEWTGAGYTTDGIEVSYEPDYGEVTVDQALDSVKMFKQAMSVSVNTTLSEATLFNLMVAWGQSEVNTLGDNGNRLDISGGELHDDPIERSLAFVGKAPRADNGDKQERVYYLRRALQVESSAHSLSRADATTFPVSFRCLPGDTATDGDYGFILQRTITGAP